MPVHVPGDYTHEVADETIAHCDDVQTAALNDECKLM